MRFGSRRASTLGAILVAAVATLQWRHIDRILAGRSPKLVEGTVAPPLQLTDKEGANIPLSELRGVPLVVTFWAAWCAPCRTELPELAAAIEKWNGGAESQDRALLVAINESDEVDSLSTFFVDPRLGPVRFAFDRTGATSKQWGVRAFPTTVLVDRGGRVREIQEGYDRRMAHRLERFLRDEGAAKPRP
jgi:cytochrome c biogenesis protein CcmG, thiol:disulfide interchange protein DsbE